MRKIMVVTGTRADYGIYYPILKAIEKDPKLELQLLVTGMHLSTQYGNTEQYILNDGFAITARVECLFQNATHANMARSIAIGILGMTQAFETFGPDCVLVLGDRGEMLAAAIAASHMNILLAHLHGGEISGTIDESVRHAISKLAHIHFAATEGSKERLLRMGEEAKRVYVVGAPRIETILNTPLPELNATKLKYGLEKIDTYKLFIYHPVTTEQADLDELRAMLRVLADSKGSIIAIRPNADAGTEELSEVYEEFEDYDNLYWITSFEQLDYLTMLKYAELLIGNSSSGIIEAASFQVPVINVGSRQSGRERSNNVIDIEANARDLIEALEYSETADFDSGMKELTNVYEQSDTSQRIVRVLNQVDLSGNWLQKKMTY
ncbi:UDP-N-acetylglucosamine 2-epimerase (hydrolyzing) [Saccharibacillus sp. O23]|uniref:UDP-N-acetylglucosamine 2-epimerase n=1 Tax=Saccharibacillus sp. O23 TaxID=2009338 RepID=UPI000B4E7B1B|nr:UDP-N-acetylglucosamine 2-epimerase [Saccharibacillus sp. O23]OWR27591.1 UDP-N-acetylglucosamine 2-epimerase (hydrolyzing) [Saccharibacillus sp. O23]